MITPENCMVNEPSAKNYQQEAMRGSRCNIRQELFRLSVEKALTTRLFCRLRISGPCRRRSGSSDRKRRGNRLSAGDFHLRSPDFHLGSDASPESGDQKTGTDLNVILAFSEMLLFSCFLFSAVVKSGQEAYKKRGRRNRRWRLRADKTVVFHMRQKNPTENIKEEASCPSSNSP